MSKARDLANIPAGSGDLAVDTDTLVVDATNDRVGIGTASPVLPLHVSTAGSGVTEVLRLTTTSPNTVPGIVFEGDSGGTQHDNAIIRAQQNNATNGGIIFETEGSGALAERMRLDNSGHLIVPEGITLGTAAGTYSAANTLNDYETGTFDISLQAGGADWYGPITHQYVKIGNAVLIMGEPSVAPSSVTSATGAITVKTGTSLPFTPNHWGSLSWVGNMRSIDGTDVTQGPHLRFGPGGATALAIGTQDSTFSGAGSWTTGYNVVSSGTQTAHYSWFQGVYYTND